MSERALWLQAVESFRQDINTSVQCPACTIGYLQVMDVPFDDKNVSKGGERYLKCSNCNRVEIVLYRNPPANWMTLKSNC